MCPVLTLALGTVLGAGSREDSQEANEDSQEKNGMMVLPQTDVAPESDPLQPAFLLQLIKLLRRKETLLKSAKQYNNSMRDLRLQGEHKHQVPTNGVGASVGEDDAPSALASRGLPDRPRGLGCEKENERLIKREYAWTVVQVDRANFQLRNALWGVAMGLHAQPASSLSSVRRGRYGKEADDSNASRLDNQHFDEASARDSLMALSRGERVERPGGGGGGTNHNKCRNAMVVKCTDNASALIHAVTASVESDNGSQSGTSSKLGTAACARLRKCTNNASSDSRCNCLC